ncbi:MAG TPA: HEAT repeat domain-containing protein [Candidatus Limnocylindrales bacterium]
MPLFGPPNVAQLEAKGDVQGLIKALLYKDAAVRVAAAEALTPLKHPTAVDPLAAALRDENPSVRKACVGALAARGGLRVVNPLVGALQDPDPNVRSAAAAAVYRRLMTDPDQDARRETIMALGKVRPADAVEPLIKAIMDADEGVRVAAIKSLQAVGDVRAIPSLVVVLAHEQVRQKATGLSSPNVERAATAALDALCDPKAIEPLKISLAHDDADVREIAVRRLAKIGTPQVADCLVASLSDEDPVIRRSAARGLQEIGWQPPANLVGANYWAALREWRRCGECGPDAIPVLTSAFHHSDAMEQSEIVASLVQVGWLPDEANDMAAHYWVSQRRWDKCLEIGEPAAGALDIFVRNADIWRERVAASITLAEIGQPRPYPFHRLDLVRDALAILDGEGTAEEKRYALEGFLAHAGMYKPNAHERVEYCRCGYPAARVRRDGLREPLTEILGFENAGANSTTYYCPSCDTRRITVAR